MFGSNLCFSYSPRSHSQPRGCTEARFTALLARWRQKKRPCWHQKNGGEKENTNTWVIYPPTINWHMAMSQNPGTLGTLNRWFMPVYSPKYGSNRFWPIPICVYVCVYIKYMYIWKTHKMVGFFVQMLTVGWVHLNAIPHFKYLAHVPPSGPHWCSLPLSPGRKHS